MRFEISQRNIEDGVKGHPRHCPIAIALQQKGLKNVIVGDYSVWTAGVEVPLTPQLLRFRRAFDAGMRVMPAGYNLRIPRVES